MTEEEAVFYLDFQKAFDKVPYDKLLETLITPGLDSKALEINAHYLTVRKHQVRINHSFSCFLRRNPSRVLLEPLLILAYINYLPESIDDSPTYGYADDYKLISCNYNLLKNDVDKLNF